MSPVIRRSDGSEFGGMGASRYVNTQGGKGKPYVSPKWRPPTKVPAGWVYVYCDEPVARIQTRLGPEPWIPTAGFSGWEVVERPHQVGMTIPSGVEPIQYQGSLMFDGWMTRTSQEADIKRLILMAHGDDDHEPGIISIVGVPDLPSEDWVIEDLVFDADSIIRDDVTMDRLRAKVSLTIREYVSPKYLRITKNALGKPKGNYTFVKTRAGDTPHRVALRHKVRVRDILELNKAQKIVKANQKLKANMSIRIPIPDNKSSKDKKSSTKSRG